MVMSTTTLAECAAPVTFHHCDIGFLKKHQSTNTGHGAVPAHNNAKHLIGEAFRRRLAYIDHEFCDPGDEDTFFVADLGEVYRQQMRWKRCLPRVKPFYAVKCNPDPKVLQLLAALGNGFDCASKSEIEQVLHLGVDPSRIIYAQPCKTNSYVRYVAAHGVRQMTFDNADELRKIARLFPDADLFLRILTDDSSSLCRLSLKFGASLDTTDSLLGLARALGLRVVGVSFHVGSGASDPGAFRKAVADAAAVFDQAAAHGYRLHTLDVGGGFCSDASFEAMAGVLGNALNDHFPPHRGVSLIAEPGRFFAASAFTLACHVIARRTVEDPEQQKTATTTTVAAGSTAAAVPPTYMLYVNDGLYGNFSSIMFDHQNPVAKVLCAGSRFLYDTQEAHATDDLADNDDNAVVGSVRSVGSVDSMTSSVDSLDGMALSVDGVRADRANTAASTEYSIWGPTCDGIDRIAERIRFRQTLDVGDWLYFEDMGAYTSCSATRFNGFTDNHDVLYVCSEPGARALLKM